MRWACVALLFLMSGVLFGCGRAATDAAVKLGGYGHQVAYPTAEAEPPASPQQPAPAGAPAGADEGYGYLFEDDPSSAGGFGSGKTAAAAPAPEPPPGAAAPPPATGAPPAPPAAVPDAATGPLLIYEAQVQIAVFETEKALGAAEQVMQKAKGYLVRRTDQTITFRVPAPAFQAALDEVLQLGDVVHRQVSARDVTDEFYDVQTRTKTLEALRDRLQELLSRARDVEEALAVERELGRIVEEIERLKGRLKLLRELIAFSTITVEFRPRAVESIESTVELPFPWLKELGLGELLSL